MDVWTLIFYLAPPALIVCAALGIRVGLHRMIAAAAGVVSIIVGAELAYFSLDDSCQLGTSECVRAQVTAFSFGIIWLIALVVLVASIWNAREAR